MQQYEEFHTSGYYRVFKINTNADTVSYQERSMRIDAFRLNLTEMSFTIDGLASGSKVNCLKDHLEDHPKLKIMNCSGPIQLKN